MFYWVTYSTSWHTWATMGAQQKKHSTRQRPEIFGVLSSPWYQWSPTSWSPCCKEIYFWDGVFPQMDALTRTPCCESSLISVDLFVFFLCFAFWSDFLECTLVSMWKDGQWLLISPYPWTGVIWYIYYDRNKSISSYCDMIYFGNHIFCREVLDQARVNQQNNWTDKWIHCDMIEILKQNRDVRYWSKTTNSL